MILYNLLGSKNSKFSTYFVINALYYNNYKHRIQLNIMIIYY
jgi:hypothetical protein